MGFCTRLDFVGLNSGGGGGNRTRVRKPSARSSYMLFPSFKSHLIRRLGESSGISQPGLSHPPVPDNTGRPARIVTSVQPLGRQPQDVVA